MSRPTVYCIADQGGIMVFAVINQPTTFFWYSKIKLYITIFSQDLNFIYLLKL